MSRTDAHSSFPSPREARLIRTQGRGGAPPGPPFGLTTWSESEGSAVVVLLDLLAGWTASATGGVAEIAAQIPPAATLPAGTLVFVLGTGDRAGGVVARWLRPRRRVPRAIRGSALLAQGYVQLRGAVDPKSREDLVWGSVPAST